MTIYDRESAERFLINVMRGKRLIFPNPLKLESLNDVYIAVGMLCAKTLPFCEDYWEEQFNPGKYLNSGFTYLKEGILNPMPLFGSDEAFKLPHNFKGGSEEIKKARHSAECIFRFYQACWRLCNDGGSGSQYKIIDSLRCCARVIGWACINEILPELVTERSYFNLEDAKREIGVTNRGTK